MSKYIIADGTTIKRGTTTAARVRALTPPSDTWEKIDVTSLENLSVHTYIVSEISETGDVTMTLGTRDAYEMEKGNAEWTVELPDGSTCVFWGDLLSRTPSQLVVKNESLTDVVIAVTNLNESEEETPPQWTWANGEI